MMYSIPKWRSPPEEMNLPHNEAHIWCGRLNLMRAKVETFSKILSQDESERASKFVFEKDREQFILCRALLRQILGKYLPQIPSQLSFSYGSYGKPSLLQSSQDDLLCFNLSHSKDVVLYVLSRDPNIGIDLEYLRADFNHEEIVQRLCCGSCFTTRFESIQLLAVGFRTIEKFSRFCAAWNDAGDSHLRCLFF